MIQLIQGIKALESITTHLVILVKPLSGLPKKNTGGYKGSKVIQTIQKVVTRRIIALTILLSLLFAAIAPGVIISQGITKGGSIVAKSKLLRVKVSESTSRPWKLIKW